MTNKQAMNTKAIERIKGYCCEVTQEQWEELVRVADEVGVVIGDWASTKSKLQSQRFAWVTDRYSIDRIVHRSHRAKFPEIPFPDFLAKLRGEEEWTPKAGEMVEVQTVGGVHTGEYMGFFGGEHWVFFDDSPNSCCTVDPLRPTITRTEAEQKLGMRIVD